MRKWTATSCTLAVMGLVAGPAISQPTQLLLNPSFEDGPASPLQPRDDVPDHWTLASPDFAGQDRKVEYMDADAQYVGFNASNTGERYLYDPSHWDCDWAYAEQSVSASGELDLALSFWAVVYDTGVYPSSVIGELIVDGEVKASASLSYADPTPEEQPSQLPNSGQKQVWATWKGTVVSQITVRITLIADGAGRGSLGIAGVDDVELWSSACATTPAVGDVDPNVITTPAGNTVVTLSGSDLDQVSAVRLWGDNAVEVPGSNLNFVDPDLEVLLATAGAEPGFYDLIVEQTGCNPRVITGALQVLDTSAPQNLLVNGSFEVPENSGNGQIWSGDYLIYSVPHGEGARIHTPTPDHLDGERGWEISDGIGQLQTPSGSQAALVASGDAVSFSGWVHTGPGGTGVTNQVTITVWDGPIGGTTIAPPVTVDENTPPTNPGGPTGEWVNVIISGPAYNGSVTVQFEAICQGGAGGAAAVHLDAFSVTADPQCTQAQRPRFSYPSRGPHDSDAVVTIIGGTNLDRVTGVSLVFVDRVNEGTPEDPMGDETEIIVPGTIVPGSQVPTGLSVSFPLPANNVPVGLYNLVIEQPGCPTSNLEFARVDRTAGAVAPEFHANVPPTFVDKFEVYCGTPVVFAGMDPPRLNAPQPDPVDFTVTGQNLDRLATVSLAFRQAEPPIEIPGTILTVAPGGGEMTARFNLAGAEYAPYELIGIHNDTLCHGPEPLAAAFTLMPPFGVQLLFNGDFELGPGYLGGESHIPPGDGWVMSADSDPIGSDGNPILPKYNNTSHAPGLPVAGDDWGSLDVGEGFGAHSDPPHYCRVVQTVTVVPNMTVSLTGHIAGGNNRIPPEFPDEGYDHQISILDGDETGSEMARFALRSHEIMPLGWTPFPTLTGMPTGNAVTIEWGWENGIIAGWNVVGTHVDELLLIQTPCNDPFADADNDGDVDQADFGSFQNCYTGPGGGVPAEPEYCFCFDVEGPGGMPDADVDQADLAAFEACASGPAIAADETCDDPPLAEE